LAPTREIAVQIQQVICSIGCAIPPLCCRTFIGGLPLADDVAKLKKCHIAVGTPGTVACNVRSITVEISTASRIASKTICLGRRERTGGIICHI